MMKTTPVKIQYYTEAKNAQGGSVKTFYALKTIWANVQPKSLTPVQAEEWGINAQNANTKWMGFDIDATIHELYRAIVKGVTYEIRGINTWPIHSEALLIPISGIAIQLFIVSLDPVALKGKEYVWDDFAYWRDNGVWMES